MGQDLGVPIIESDWHLQKLCRRADALGDVCTRCRVYTVTLDLVNCDCVSDILVLDQSKLYIVWKEYDRANRP